MPDPLNPTFTVLANDKPLACSRCGGPIGNKLVTAEWNRIHFGYCSACQTAMEPK